ncbi:MAG: glycerol acyltransferase [Gammaproteobacteria bacterium]|nr:MAG: glycerol acyltransferase [Gammaproteobacteria bacterium]
MTLKPDNDNQAYQDKILTSYDLGHNVPKRGGKMIPLLSRFFLKLTGWKTVGEIPNIPQAVCVAVPHTSNVDGIYALPAIFALNFGVKIMGKKSLFKNPIMAKVMHWSGVIPVDREKKGSVLQASIDEFKKGKPLFIGLAPEGTRGYTKEWKSGFYYLAVGAGVPILPVAMDYKTKEIRFMNLVHPTGDYDVDLLKILAMYKGVVPKDPNNLSQPLQDLKNKA